MQAKIIDFASDKLVSALQKIDKKDVHKVMTNISGKVQSKNDKAKADVTSSDEYCAMLQKEFVFLPNDVRKDKTVLEIEDKKDVVLKIDGVDAGKDEKGKGRFLSL
jgi:hypothetical protein